MNINFLSPSDQKIVRAMIYDNAILDIVDDIADDDDIVNRFELVKTVASRLSVSHGVAAMLVTVTVGGDN